MASKGMKIAIALQHLRLDKTATEETVKLAYRELAKMWHPDKYRDGDPMKPEALRQIQLVNEAKTVALAYIKKYGHFRHVRDPGMENPRRNTPPRPPPRQEPPKQEPPPRSNTQDQTRQKTYQSGPKQAPPKDQTHKSRPGPEPKTEPKRKKPPEPEPSRAYTRDFDEGLSFSDFIPSTAAMVGTAILVAIVFFLYSMISAAFNSPVDRFKDFTEKAALEEGQKLTIDQSVIEEEEMADFVEEEEPPLESQVDTFFTLGSDKSWVSYVQGPPLQIKGHIWRYGFSTITFKGDSVIGWNNSALNPIKVGIIRDPNDVYPYSTFGIGSKMSDVVALQGAPDVVVDSLWSYGDAKVTFSNGIVINFVDDVQNRLAVQ